MLLSALPVSANPLVSIICFDSYVYSAFFLYVTVSCQLDVQFVKQNPPLPAAFRPQKNTAISARPTRTTTWGPIEQTEGRNSHVTNDEAHLRPQPGSFRRCLVELALLSH